MANYKSGEAFIEILNAHNVDKVFLNPGFEYLDILSSVASARTDGKKAPQLVLCLDESVAAAAAYGSYMVTGRPQTVMVHSEIGSLQLGANLQNLQWGRVPVVIMAAYQEADARRTLWNGQPHDQGGIVRNSVKYDRLLQGDEDLHEALTEAFRIACTEPTGPVYLSFPMSYLYKDIEKRDVRPEKTDPLPAVDMEKLAEVADILLAAKNPLLVGGHTGRHAPSVKAFTTLAETLSAMVITGYSWMNFPSNHPLCVGIEQIGGSRKTDAGYEEADVILAIDYDMPYVGSAPPPDPSAKILHIDADPLTQGRLLWERGADIFIKADAYEAMPALDKLLKEKMTDEKRAELDERFQRIAAENEHARQKWHTDARNQSGQDPISADYLCYCLNQVIDEDTIFLNHTLSHCASVTEQIVRTKPGTWFGCPSGAIGWASGAALGAASAAAGKTVVAAMTDGGFVWGCPTSTFWTSSNYKFPFLAVIFNNNGYGAIRGPQQEMLGGILPNEQFIAESAVDFQIDYALTAQGSGAFGRNVAKPEDVLPALKEALAAVRGGKPAVLNVRL
jgi:acetolactate synthase-1/2/3 large subunit